jgi:LPXTG-motif cell wall-anchored protein
MISSLSCSSRNSGDRLRARGRIFHQVSGEVRLPSNHFMPKKEGGTMSLIRKLMLLLIIAALPVVPLFAQAASVTVNLSPQNNSGESGTAVLTDLGNGKTQVVLTVTGQPAGVSQPVHIHKGTCANLDPKPAYPLSPLVDGKSETTVDVSLQTLQSSPFAINGHKSAEEISVYVFCGDIPLAVTLPATGGASALSLVALALGLLALGSGWLVRRFAR